MKTWQRSKKLTTEQVQEIRHRVAQGQTRAQIAPDYGVGPYCVRDIAQGRTWGWLDDAEEQDY